MLDGKAVVVGHEKLGGIFTEQGIPGVGIVCRDACVFFHGRGDGGEVGFLRFLAVVPLCAEKADFIFHLYHDHGIFFAVCFPKVGPVSYTHLFMARTYVTLETMKEDGKLYDNKLRDTVESLIPNPYESCHAADLLELPGGDLLCCWFAGSNEGNADISIVVSRLKAGESQWSIPVKVSDDAERSEQKDVYKRQASGRRGV